MHQTVLMDADVHENAEVDDIAHRAGQLHAGLQILHFQHVLAQNGGGQLVPGVAAGLAQLLSDIKQCRLTHGAFRGGLAQAVGVQLFRQGREIVALFAAQKVQQRLCGGVGLRMDAGVVQNLLAFGDTQETGALLKGFRAELGNLFQLCAAGEGAVFFPIGDDILRRGGGQTGNLLQKAPGSGVGVHAHGVDAVLHHSAKGGVQLLLGAVVLVLSHADGLGVDLHQLGKGVLQPPGDGHGGAEIDVVVGEFLRRKGRGGINGSARFADDHVAGLREGFQQLYGHGLGFPGSGAVADGDMPDAVFAHKNGQGGNGFLLFPLIEGGVNHGGGQYLAGCVHHGDLAAVAVSGVKPHGDEAFDRGLHQQRLQIQGKIADSARIRPVGQVAAHLPLDGWENQPLIGVLSGGADEAQMDAMAAEALRFIRQKSKEAQK